MPERDNAVYIISVAAELAGTHPQTLRIYERRGLIESDWGTSENNRRAKFYRLTPDGQTQIRRETKAWLDHAALVRRALEIPSTPASAS